MKQMESVDQAKVRNIILLLWELVSEAIAQKSSIGTAVTDAQALLDAQASSLEATNGALVTAQQVVITVQTEKNNSQGARQAYSSN